jgi:hypothetical protein
VIAIILFWIFNINTKTQTNKKTEYFGKTESPLLSVSSSMSNSTVQDILTKPPTNNNNKPTTQLPSIQQQPMYTNITSEPNKQVASLSSTNDSYMLLPSNNMPDEKFTKVMSKDSRPVLTSGDLLPKDENKDWFQVPNSKFDLMQAVDLEVPEIKIGVDTVGQSRKNATYDLRAAPPNPKFVVSPWSNSTIEPDYNTKPLC